MANTLEIEAGEGIIELETGSFPAEIFVQLSNRQQVNGLDVPIAVPLNLYESKIPTLEQTVAKIKRLYGYPCGILANTFQREHFPGDPPWFEFHIAPCTSRYLNYDIQSYGQRSGNSAAITRNEALVAATGEAVERYASSLFTRENLILASYAQLQAAGLNATPLEDYVYFDESQYEELSFLHMEVRPPSAATPAWWQWGHSMVSGKPILVPAVYCQLPFWVDNLQKEDAAYCFWDYQSSTGLSAHGTLEMAILRSLYEVVERDAIMLTWLNKLPATGLHLEGATDPELLEVLDSIPFSRKDCYITNITLDIGLTTCFGVYISPDGRKPYSAVSAACGLDPQKVAARCLRELVLGYTAMGEYCFKPPATAHEKALMAGDYSQCNTLNEHFGLFAGRDLRDEMAFLSTRPAKWAAIEDLPNLATGSVLGDLEKSVGMLAKHGLEVVALDLTTEDVAQAGFKVARVLIPGLQPLDPDHRARHLKSRRLQQIKRILGLADRDMTPADYNPVPHPFP